MEKLFFIACAFIICPSFNSSDICFKYFPDEKGIIYEMTNYSAKDKITSKTEGTVLEAEKTSTSFTMKIGTKIFDDKGKETASGNYIAKCENNKFYLDMSNMLPTQTMDAYRGMEMEMTGGFMEFPSDPEPGEMLPDADMTMSFLSGGTPIMNMTAAITERKVEGFETITTTAGTFECIKFSQTINMKLVFKITAKSITWMAEDVGVVKTENYNDKGKLEGYSLLTKFHN